MAWQISEAGVVSLGDCLCLTSCVSFGQRLPITHIHLRLKMYVSCLNTKAVMYHHVARPNFNLLAKSKRPRARHRKEGNLCKCLTKYSY